MSEVSSLEVVGRAWRNGGRDRGRVDEEELDWAVMGGEGSGGKGGVIFFVAV